MVWSPILLKAWELCAFGAMIAGGNGMEMVEGCELMDRQRRFVEYG